MSTLIRTHFRKAFSNASIQVSKRQAHKKAGIQVRLNDYVEGIGIRGQIVTIRPGMMRNLLYPNGKASYIVKGDTSLSTGLENGSQMKGEVVEGSNLEEAMARLKKNFEEKEELGKRLDSIQQVIFTRAVVPNSVHTFGSVTAEDIVSKLKEQFDLNIGAADIKFESEGGRIKSLGKHRVSVRRGEAKTEIDVIVNAAA